MPDESHTKNINRFFKRHVHHNLFELAISPLKLPFAYKKRDKLLVKAICIWAGAIVLCYTWPLLVPLALVTSAIALALAVAALAVQALALVVGSILDARPTENLKPTTPLP